MDSIEIPLKGYGEKYNAIVCKCHYRLLAGKNWSFDGRYARAVENRTRKIYMHKLIQKGEVIDHINRDKLDNRCTNLRAVTYSENLLNKGVRSDSTTGVTGVTYVKRNKKWMARYKLEFLGYYDSLSKAAQARKKREVVA